MLRSRRPLAVAGVLLVLGVGLLTVLRRPPPLAYLSGGGLVLEDGVPEMQAAPAVACPPVLVQGVLQGRSVQPGGAAAGSLATVYVITPTYPRAVQVPEMTRLAQTLMLATNVFWVVTEDATQLTPAVTEILQRSGVPHVHILGLKPERFSKKAGFRGAVPRGVSNRMAALEWLRQNARDGVFYFADDDNTYDYRLFAELARTRRVSAFPVGLVTQTGLSTPLVRDGAVVDFYDGWIGGRTFPMDMAGFAVSVQLLLQHPKAAMPFTAGYEEDGFLKSLGLKRDDLEPLADNCTKILVWHTQTKQPKVPFTAVDPAKYRGTNLEVLRHIVNPSSSPRFRARPPSSPAATPGRSAAPAHLKTPGRHAAAPSLKTPGRSIPVAHLKAAGRHAPAPLRTPGRSAAPVGAPGRSAAPVGAPGRSAAPVGAPGRSTAPVGAPGRSAAAPESISAVAVSSQHSSTGNTASNAPSNAFGNTASNAVGNASASNPPPTPGDTAMGNQVPIRSNPTDRDQRWLSAPDGANLTRPLAKAQNASLRIPMPTFRNVTDTGTVLDVANATAAMDPLPVAGNATSRGMGSIRNTSPFVESRVNFRSSIPTSLQRFLDFHRPTAHSQPQSIRSLPRNFRSQFQSSRLQSYFPLSQSRSPQSQSESPHYPPESSLSPSQSHPFQSPFRTSLLLPDGPVWPVQRSSSHLSAPPRSPPSEGPAVPSPSSDGQGVISQPPVGGGSPSPPPVGGQSPSSGVGGWSEGTGQPPLPCPPGSYAGPLTTVSNSPKAGSAREDGPD